MSRFRFTMARIEALPLPEPGKRDTYHDTKISGLQLRVSHTGTKTFSFYRRIKHGEPQRITLGKFPDLTVDAAEHKALELSLAIARNENPAKALRDKKEELTFGKLFFEYLERHSKPNKRTWQEDESKYKQYLEKKIGKMKATEIDRKDIASIHSAITRAGHPVTANRVKALISSIFGWGISAGLVKENPAIGIRSNKETARDRWLLGDELQRFFAALAEEQNDTIRDYFLASVLTGVRQENILSMKWADINFMRQEWSIQRTKNDLPQTVTLSAELVSILEQRKAKSSSDYVFPGSGKTGHLVEPKKGWKRLLERSGIENLRIHDLRRTLGSWQARTGASLPIIGKSLNHKNLSTTLIYARLDTDPVRASVDKATAAMLEAANVKKDTELFPLKNEK